MFYYYYGTQVNTQVKLKYKVMEELDPLITTEENPFLTFLPCLFIVLIDLGIILAVVLLKMPDDDP